MNGVLSSKEFRPFRASPAARRTIVVCLLTVLLFSGIACSRKDEKATEASPKEQQHDPNLATMQPDAQKNIGLQTATVETRPLIQQVQTTGSVGPNETRVAEVRPLATGRVLNVYVRLGERVQAGQRLATYDNVELGELTGQVDVARANLRKANTDSEVTKRSVERAQNLVGLGALAQAELERRRAEFSSSLASIDTQKAELAKIDEKLHRFGLSDPEIQKLESRAEGHREVSRTTITAPFSGVITKYEVAIGEFVDTSRALFTVADLSTVWVQANVYEKDIALVQQDSTVKVTVDAYPQRAFQGRITYISDVLDPKTRTARVRCEVSNPERLLKLDMFATIELPSPRKRDTRMVPSAAIQQIDDRPIVFVPKDAQTFERRNIKLGERAANWVEVTEGVQAGERVVTKGSFQLKSILLREQIGGNE